MSNQTNAHAMSNPVTVEIPASSVEIPALKTNETSSVIPEVTAEVLPKVEVTSESKNQLIDEIMNVTSQLAPEALKVIQDIQKAEKETLVSNGKQIIGQFASHLMSKEFTDKCEEMSVKHQLPPKVIAKNFCLRVLGIIGDCLGIAINVTRNFVKSTIDLLLGILKSGVDIICNVAEGLARLLTLNQTAQAN